MCQKRKNKSQEANIAVHLATKEQADIFFQQTVIQDPSCECTNYDSYGHETAYHLGYEEFGNVRMYKSSGYREGTTVVMSFEQYMYIFSSGIGSTLNVEKLLAKVN